MAQTSIVAVDIVLFVLAVYILRRLVLSRSSHRLFPPGPPGLPIVNNLFDWPSKKEWEICSQWASRYGDIVHVKVGDTHIIVLSSVGVATDLLQGRGSIYSDRPSLYVAGELIGLNKAMALMHDGSTLKESRRFFTQQMGTGQALTRFEPMMQTRIKHFVSKLLTNPEVQTDFFSHIFVLTSGIILDATYGYDIKDSQDELLLLGQHTVDDISVAARPGAFIIDIFPWIDRLPSWFPFTGYRKTIAEMRKRYIDFRDIPFDYVKAHINNEEMVQRCCVANQLQSENLTAEQEVDLRATAASSFGAGSDTTISAINHFFFFMAKYPEIQIKAQEEIDRVIGDSRLPSMLDEPNLPYVNALISEVLRCGPIAPMGLAHKLRVDDVYNGYLLPKDSIVFGNIWHMSRDQRYYKNPEIFDPTRFLSDTPELDPRIYVFGFGRRVCSGRLFAEQSLFLTITTALATLRISKAKDSKGAAIEPVMDHNSEGLITHLKPYIMKVDARSGSINVEALLTMDYFAE